MDDGSKQIVCHVPSPPLPSPSLMYLEGPKPKRGGMAKSAAVAKCMAFAHDLSRCCTNPSRLILVVIPFVRHPPAPYHTTTGLVVVWPTYRAGVVDVQGCILAVRPCHSRECACLARNREAGIRIVQVEVMVTRCCGQVRGICSRLVPSSSLALYLSKC